MLQDYHLYLVAGLIRATLPTVALSHFIHIPWPEARYWRLIPHRFLFQIVGSLLCNHVIGFQTAQDMRNFVACVRELFPAAEQTPVEGGIAIAWNGRRFLANVYPVAIDPEHLRISAQTKTAQEYGRAPASSSRRQLILRVDRVDPSKNLVRGLEAFVLMLRQHPQMRRHVTFLMLLLPERSGLARNRRYARQVMAMCARINRE